MSVFPFKSLVLLIWCVFKAGIETVSQSKGFKNKLIKLQRKLFQWKQKETIMVRTTSTNFPFCSWIELKLVIVFLRVSINYSNRSTNTATVETVLHCKCAIPRLKYVMSSLTIPKTRWWLPIASYKQWAAFIDLSITQSALWSCPTSHSWMLIVLESWDTKFLCLFSTVDCTLFYSQWLAQMLLWISSTMDWLSWLLSKSFMISCWSSINSAMKKRIRIEEWLSTSNGQFLLPCLPWTKIALRTYELKFAHFLEMLNQLFLKLVQCWNGWSEMMIHRSQII